MVEKLGLVLGLLMVVRGHERVLPDRAEQCSNDVGGAQLTEEMIPLETTIVLAKVYSRPQVEVLLHEG